MSICLHWGGFGGQWGGIYGSPMECLGICIDHVDLIFSGVVLGFGLALGDPEPQTDNEGCEERGQTSNDKKGPMI